MEGTVGLIGNVNWCKNCACDFDFAFSMIEFLSSYWPGPGCSIALLLNLSVPDLKTAEIWAWGLILIFMSLTENTSSYSLPNFSGLVSFFLSALAERLRGCVDPKGAHACLRELPRELGWYCPKWSKRYLARACWWSRSWSCVRSAQKMTLRIILLRGW